MKKYSNAGLLTEEFAMIPFATDFIGKLLYKMNKNSSILLNVDVPLNLYLRGEVFCEDISDLSEFSFDQKDLLNLLYNDFLLFVKKNPDPRALFRLLVSLDEESGKDASLQKQQGASIFKVVYTEKNQKTQTFEVRMRKKLALRGEVLLADMDLAYPDHGYTLERILALLYCDFIDKYRKGDNVEAINKILSILENE
jgi:hypothetical protein